MLHNRRLGAVGSVVQTYSLFGVANINFAPPNSTSSNSWTNRAFTLGNAALHVDVAPGGDSNTGHRWRILFDSTGQLGSAVDLTDGATTSSGSLATTIAVSTDPEGTGAYSPQRFILGAPATPSDFTVSQEYVDSMNPALVYLASGDGTTNISSDVTDKFMGFFRTGGNPTETSFQNVIGVNGVLENFFGRFGFGAGLNTHELAIRKNGADAFVTSVTNTGSSGFFFSSAMSVNVVKGDLLSIRFKRTVGAATNYVAYIMCTFRAT